MSLRRCLMPGGEAYSATGTSTSSSSYSYTTSSASGSSYTSSSSMAPRRAAAPRAPAESSAAYNPDVRYTNAEAPSVSSGDESEFDTYNILQDYEQNRALDRVSAPPNASLLYEPKRPFTPYITVGPVIGMVSETVARILIETSADVEVKCFCTDSHGVQHGVSKQCDKGVPTVFLFEELRAGTKYRVSFNIPVPGVVAASFTTLRPNWGGVKAPARIAAVSNHDLRAVAGTKIGGSKDAWKKLYSANRNGEKLAKLLHQQMYDSTTDDSKSVKMPKYEAADLGHFDYLLLLGNLVYVDSSDYVETNEGRLPTEANDAVFLDALELVEDLAASQFAEFEGKILEMFRNVYRDTLAHPTLRHVLANIPCLALPGEMELGLCMDDESDAARNFVHACAYKVYNQYFRALFEDVVANDENGGEVVIGQAYHFHAFGDIGFMLLDTKAHPIFHRSTKHTHETPYLGYRQWADIDYALSESGYLSLCRTIVVGSVTPIVLAPESVWLTASMEKQMELLSTWACADGFDEASLLLSKLNDWKNRKPGRDVVLMCGNQVNGGTTKITDKRYSEGTVMQVTAGPIAVKNNKGVSKLQGGLANCGVGVYHRFSHTKLTKTPGSFGYVRISNDKDTGITVDARVKA